MNTTNGSALLRKLSERLLSLFFINRKAAAIQGEDGRYYTKYFDIDSTVIFEVLLQRKSIGSYQQYYRNSKLKWACLDYDSPKDCPDPGSLYETCVRPVMTYLDKKGIFAYTEYSGRRGIHVWIFFDEDVEKEVAFRILQQINADCPIADSKFSLDRYPTVPSAKNNRLGKQVKMPLSCHTKGGQSYFFSGPFVRKRTGSIEFFEEQLSFIEGIQFNDANQIIKSLGLSDLPMQLTVKPMKRQYSISDRQFSAQEILDALSRDTLLGKIVERLLNNSLSTEDRHVLLGTLGHIGDGSLIHDVLKCGEGYQSDLTESFKSHLLNRYYPPTFGYLSLLYGETLAEGRDPEQTTLEFLSRELSFEIKEAVSSPLFRQKYVYNSIPLIAHKELLYLVENDECVNISYYDSLREFDDLDCLLVSRRIKRIGVANISSIERLAKKDARLFTKYIRIEEDKKRILLSLPPEERVLTTTLAVECAYALHRSKTSYSYNIDFYSADNLFYYWYYSWRNYLTAIRPYLEVPFLANRCILVADIYHCYDSIDFARIKTQLQKQSSLPKSIRAKLNYLIAFNDQIMIRAFKRRTGVPQGPAYARVLAELFLSVCLEQFEHGLRENGGMLFRYVDDITIIYNDAKTGDEILRELRETLSAFGLQINEKKTKIYGDCGSLSEDEKKEILKDGNFSYMSRLEEPYYLLSSGERRNLLSKTVSDSFSWREINMFFSKTVKRPFKMAYYNSFKDLIFSCKKGRGLAFSKFYQFLFNDKEAFYDALRNKLFLKIPINTINFQNMISQCYLSYLDGVIDKKMMKVLAKEYLSDIGSVRDIDTRTTLYRLLLIGGRVENE